MIEEQLSDIREEFSCLNAELREINEHMAILTRFCSLLIPYLEEAEKEAVA